ncbi:adenosine kinase [Candidatus Woesearchaeota archaeon]|nr:adenosine kinase [Candidatus Woesearchaeota archaeon]
MYDVIGISHALVDVCAQVSDGFLEDNSLTKGDEHLVDMEIFMYIHGQLKNPEIKFGSSVSNTLAGLNMMGCKVGEFAKVGKDGYGQMLIDEKNIKGMGNFLSYDDLPTGAVICLITPDAERTFVVYLGAAQRLAPDDISEEIIKQTRFLHITAYEFESIHETTMKAVKLARKHGVKVSFDLGSPGLVERNRLNLKKFIEEYADIVFANKDEAFQLTGEDPVKAINIIADLCDIAIIKLGEEGSMIKADDKVYDIPAYQVETKDTTGAGDMYAAGILYGLVKGIEISQAGRIASHNAAKVCETIGARLENMEL